MSNTSAPSPPKETLDAVKSNLESFTQNVQNFRAGGSLTDVNNALQAFQNLNSNSKFASGLGMAGAAIGLWSALYQQNKKDPILTAIDSLSNQITDLEHIVNNRFESLTSLITLKAIQQQMEKPLGSLRSAKFSLNQLIEADHENEKDFKDQLNTSLKNGPSGKDMQYAFVNINTHLIGQHGLVENTLYDALYINHHGDIYKILEAHSQIIDLYISGLMYLGLLNSNLSSLTHDISHQEAIDMMDDAFNSIDSNFSAQDSSSTSSSYSNLFYSILTITDKYENKIYDELNDNLKKYWIQDLSRDNVIHENIPLCIDKLGQQINNDDYYSFLANYIQEKVQSKYPLKYWCCLVYTDFRNNKANLSRQSTLWPEKPCPKGVQQGDHYLWGTVNPNKDDYGVSVLIMWRDDFPLEDAGTFDSDAERTAHSNWLKNDSDWTPQDTLKGITEKVKINGHTFTTIYPNTIIMCMRSCASLAKSDDNNPSGIYFSNGRGKYSESNPSHAESWSKALLLFHY